MSPINKSRRNFLAVSLSAIPAVAASGNMPTPKKALDLTGYKLILEDEFNGTSLDLTKWQVGTNPSGQQWGSDSYFVTSDPQDAQLFRQVYPDSVRIRCLLAIGGGMDSYWLHEAARVPGL